MLRIDPAHPPLWRTATTLQFGADPVVVLDDPPAWQQRLVRELERGIPDEAAVPFAVALGASAQAARAFVAGLGRVLTTAEPAPRPVLLQSAGDVPRDHVDAVGAALAASGCRVEVAHPFDPPGGSGADAASVVIVAHQLVPPAFSAALMADDRPHLPVVLTAAGAEIGPYVRPGSTPCLSCLAAHRRERDPAWPAIAAQLIGRPIVAVDTSVVWEAGIVAGRMLSACESPPPGARSRSLTLHARSLRRTVQKHRPHEECRCRSLAGTATAAAPVPLEPRSPTVFARPA